MKALALLLGVACAVYIRSLPGLALLCCASLLLMLVSRLPAGFLLRTLKVPFFFFILMFPVLIFTSGGTAVFHIGFLTVYKEGLQLCGMIFLRAVSILFICCVLFSTARLNETMYAFNRLCIPSALTQLFLFTYRYIFLYRDELFRLRRAVRLRGLTRAGSILRFRTMTGLIVNLLVHGLEHSERISAAMRLRGFTGEFHSGEIKKITWTDGLKSAAVLSVCVVLVVMENI